VSEPAKDQQSTNKSGERRISTPTHWGLLKQPDNQKPATRQISFTGFISGSSERCRKYPASSAPACQAIVLWEATTGISARSLRGSRPITVGARLPGTGSVPTILRP